MNDLHGLISRMADELDYYRQLLTDDRRELHALAVEARAALATEADGQASVVGEPSDEELLELMPQQFRDDLATVSRLASYGTPVEPGIYRVSLNTGALDFARAVLARYGHQPAPLAAGEQRHPTPVPVASDIYFEFVISDADYCTEAGGSAPTYAQALSEGQHYLAQYLQDGPHTLELRRVEVLHPGAFPVPDDAPVPLPDDAQVIEPTEHTLLVPVPVPVPVSERLPELRGMFERILCVARSSGQRPVGNIQLADRLISAVVSWAALPLPQGEVEP